MEVNIWGGGGGPGQGLEEAAVMVAREETGKHLALAVCSGTVQGYKRLGWGLYRGMRNTGTARRRDWGGGRRG